MKRLVLPLVAVALVCPTSATTSYAAETGGFVGLGVASVPDYEGSDDREFLPVLIGRYTWETGQSIVMGGTAEAGRAFRVKANLVPDSVSTTWQAGPVIQYRVGREDVDNARVDALQSTDSTFEAGAFIGLATGPWNASLTFATAAETDDGHVVELAGSYELPAYNKLHMTLGADIAYADDDYMRNHFGVSTADAARSGLPVFEASRGLKDLGFSLDARYAINQKWGLIGFLKYNRMLSDAEDSPVVDDEGSENQYNVGAAVTYTY